VLLQIPVQIHGHPRPQEEVQAKPKARTLLICGPLCMRPAGGEFGLSADRAGMRSAPRQGDV